MTEKPPKTFVYKAYADTYPLSYSMVCIKKEIWEGKFKGTSKDEAFAMADQYHREAMQAAKNNGDTLLAVWIHLTVKEMIEEIYAEDENIVTAP